MWIVSLDGLIFHGIAWTFKLLPSKHTKVQHMACYAMCQYILETSVRAFHSERHLFKLALMASPGCSRWRRAFEGASQVLCDCGALAALRFRHLGQRCLKPCDFGDISISRVLHLIQRVGILNVWAKWLHRRSKMVQVQGSLWCPTLGTLFYSGFT
jgi:hypothetical protein